MRLTMSRVINNGLWWMAGLAVALDVWLAVASYQYSSPRVLVLDYYSLWTYIVCAAPILMPLIVKRAKSGTIAAICLLTSCAFNTILVMWVVLNWRYLT